MLHNTEDGCLSTCPAGESLNLHLQVVWVYNQQIAVKQTRNINRPNIDGNEVIQAHIARVNKIWESVYNGSEVFMVYTPITHHKSEMSIKSMNVLGIFFSAAQQLRSTTRTTALNINH